MEVLSSINVNKLVLTLSGGAELPLAGTGLQHLATLAPLSLSLSLSLSPCAVA